MHLKNFAVFAAVIYSVTSVALDIIHAPNTNSSATSSQRSQLHPKSTHDSPHYFETGFDADDFATKADWDRFTKKGGALMCALRRTDKVAGLLINDKRTPPSAASMWNGDLSHELETWYWRHVNPSTYNCKMDDHWKISFAMKSLGLSGKSVEQGGDNKCWRVEHWNPNKEENGQKIPAINQWYKVGEKEYRSTKAHYEFGVNTKGGAIFAFFLESPKSSASTLWYSGRKEADPADLPQLRAVSDVLWGFWNRHNPSIKNIRYFLMLGISNEMTNQLIASCLEKAGKELSAWPGTSFTTESDEGHALLGSPNGAAFAYFLMQHKSQLGCKIINKVTVFRPDDDDDLMFVDPALVFHVTDAPEPPPDEEENAKIKMRREGKVRVHKLPMFRAV